MLRGAPREAAVATLVVECAEAGRGLRGRRLLLAESAATWTPTATSSRCPRGGTPTTPTSTTTRSTRSARGRPRGVATHWRWSLHPGHHCLPGQRVPDVSPRPGLFHRGDAHPCWERLHGKDFERQARRCVGRHARAHVRNELLGVPARIADSHAPPRLEAQGPGRRRPSKPSSDNGPRPPGMATTVLATGAGSGQLETRVGARPSAGPAAARVRSSSDPAGAARGAPPRARPCLPAPRLPPWRRARRSGRSWAPWRRARGPVAAPRGRAGSPAIANLCGGTSRRTLLGHGADFRCARPRRARSLPAARRGRRRLSRGAWRCS